MGEFGECGRLARPGDAGRSGFLLLLFFFFALMLRSELYPFFKNYKIDAFSCSYFGNIGLMCSPGPDGTIPVTLLALVRRISREVLKGLITKQGDRGVPCPQKI